MGKGISLVHDRLPELADMLDLRAATCLWRPPNETPQVLSSQGLAFLKAGAREHGLI